MPLSEPAPRKPAHTRTISCTGYRREDGLWDIEGSLLDTRSYLTKTPWREVPPGDPVHQMFARLTITTAFEVVTVESATDSSPFQTCGAIIGNFQRLVGERIGPGWNRKVKQLVGGVEGCAHHVELLCILGTVAFQTVGPALAQENPTKTSLSHPDFVLNTCHVWSEDGELVRNLFPDGARSKKAAT